MKRVCAWSRSVVVGFFVVSLCLWMGTGQSWAFQTRISDTVYVGSGKVLHGPYLFCGDSVRLDGEVDGDVFVIAQKVVVNGAVRGDFIGVANSVDINAPVAGDARVGAGEVTLRSAVGGSFTAAASSLYIEKNGRVGRDLVFAVNRFGLDGEVGRHVSATGETVYLDGKIGGNVRLSETSSLRLGKKAVIEGDLVYSGPSKAVLQQGAQVKGKQHWTRTEGKQRYRYEKYLDVISGFLSLILIWIVLRWLLPGVWEGLGSEIADKPCKSLLMGGLAFFTIPLLAITLMFSVIGVPLALILVFFYLLLIYLSKIIVATASGMAIGRYTGWQENIHPFWLFLLGLSLVQLLTMIPQIGWAFAVTVVWLGTGAAISKVFKPKQV